jgi:hypothetical protein
MGTSSASVREHTSLHGLFPRTDGAVAVRDRLEDLAARRAAHGEEGTVCLLAVEPDGKCESLRTSDQSRLPRSCVSESLEKNCKRVQVDFWRLCVLVNDALENGKCSH